MPRLLPLFPALLIAVLLGLLWVLWRSPLQPQAWEPPPNPGLHGAFASNSRLADSHRLLPNVGLGPEDVARGPDGALYTGFEDGRIVRFDSAGHRVYAHTGGRPLGMQFDADGKLIVADAVRGLLSISADGEVSVLADSFEDTPLKFVDDLDIAEDGTIWFSDASRRYGLEDALSDLLEASATGRLLSYTPATGEVKAHLGGLYFANGVALGPHDRFILVNETGAGRILRLWLKGERAGQSEVFAEGLPGYVDNLSFNGRDTFWVALPGLRDPLLEATASMPWLRKLIAELPDSVLLPPEGGIGFVLGFGVDGTLLHNLQDPDGSYHTITSVNEWHGKLYLGSLKMASVGVLAAPDSGSFRNESFPACGETGSRRAHSPCP